MIAAPKIRIYTTMPPFTSVDDLAEELSSTTRAISITA
jgi:hypothetical protein